MCAGRAAIVILHPASFSQNALVANGPAKLPTVETARVGKQAAPSDNEKLKETLVDLEKQSWEAWKKRDGNFFKQFLSEDHVEINVGGISGKTTVVNGVGSSACVVKSYSVGGFQLTVFDTNTAVLAYHAVQDTTCGGNKVPSPVWVSSLYIKRGGRWVNALYQQTATNR
jgi:hypothetical protein